MTQTRVEKIADAIVNLAEVLSNGENVPNISTQNILDDINGSCIYRKEAEAIMELL